MSLTDWASQVARDKLESLPSRWAHVQGVARQARTLRVISGEDADLLEAAAILHDVGYAPGIAVTGFHPLEWPDSETRSIIDAALGSVPCALAWQEDAQLDDPYADRHNGSARTEGRRPHR